MDYGFAEGRRARTSKGDLVDGNAKTGYNRCGLSDPDYLRSHAGLGAMTKQSNEGLLYLQDYPRLRIWINQCVACQRLGHEPEMPLQIGPGVAAQNMRRFFPAMEINTAGLCEQCAAATQGKTD